MVFTYNYITCFSNAATSCKIKDLNQLIIKFFNINYQFLYHQIQYINYHSYNWINSDFINTYHINVINCTGIYINKKQFIICGAFKNIYKTIIYNNKITFERTKEFNDFLLSQRLLMSL